MKTIITLWRKVAFQKRIAVYFTLAIVIILAIFILVQKSNRYLTKSVEWVEHTNEVLLKNKSVLIYAQDLENGTRGYLLSGDEEYVEIFNYAALKLPQAVNELKQLTSDNSLQQARIASMYKLLVANITFRQSVIEIRRRQGFKAANELFKSGVGKRLMLQLRSITFEIEDEEKKLLVHRKEGNQESIYQLSNKIYLLQFIILFLLIIGFVVIHKNISKRNKAEASLKKSNYFINGIINNSKNPISIRDLSGKYILANNAFLQTLNISANTVIGKSYDEVLPSEMADFVRTTDAQTLSSKTTAITEHKIVLDESVHYFSSSNFPLIDEANVVYAIGSILTNITLIHQHKEALSKNNNELQRVLNGIQRLIETSKDVICIIDEEGRFKQLSATCEKLFGFSAKELIGKRYIELVHKEDVEKTDMVAGQIMQGISYRDFENRYCKKDGTYIPVSWVAIWSEEDKQMYCIAKDATEKKQTLEQLTKSEESLAYAQKIAMLGSWEVDLINKRVFCSDEFFTIIGRTKQELGFRIEDFKKIPHPDDIGVLKEALAKVLKEQQKGDVEFRIIRPDGTIVNVHGIVQLVFNEQNQPAFFKGTLQDITNQKKLEEERENVIRELTKSNADLKQFSFITSHNFKAPLSNIVAILNLINYQDLDVDNKQLFDMLSTSTNQLNQTINDLNKILIIKNSVNAELEKISFRCVYNKVENIFSNALIDAGGDITVNFKTPDVLFNRVYLESIFINLISNAINYRSSNRSLSIRITSDKDEDGNTLFIVSDNGSGIDMNRQKNKIFGLYQRFHQHKEGQGLGLYIVKSQIEALGGEIVVDSEVDKGTTFTIKFKTHWSGKENTVQKFQLNESAQ